MDKRIILVGAALVGVGFLMWQRSRSGSTTVVGGGGTLPGAGAIQSILKPIVILGGGGSPVADTTVGNVAPVAPAPMPAPATTGGAVWGGSSPGAAPAPAPEQYGGEGSGTWAGYDRSQTDSQRVLSILGTG